MYDDTAIEKGESQPGLIRENGEEVSHVPEDTSEPEKGTNKTRFV